MAISFKKVVKALSGFCILYFAGALIASPKVFIEAGQKAVLLCLNTVIPSLFPFLICSGYLSKSGILARLSRYLSPVMRPLFRLPGSSAAAFLLGVVSGYPVGAVCAVDLYKAGECSRSQAEHMCAFCNNSGPLFVISVVGVGFLGSMTVGVVLYLSMIISSIATGMIIAVFSRLKNQPERFLPSVVQTRPKELLKVLGVVMDSATLTMLKICGYIVFFSVFSAALPECTVSPYIHSAIEITGGIKHLSELGLDSSVKLPLISFFLAFSGISVLFQVGSVVVEDGISLKTYVWGKLLQAGFSAGITGILIKIFPQTVTVFNGKGSAEYLAEPLEYLSFSCITIVFWICMVFVVSYAAWAITQKCRRVD